MKRVAIISTIQPETHYTRYLYNELKKINKDVYLLIDDIKENDEFVKSQNSDKIVKLWKSDFSLPFKIGKFVDTHKIEVIHLQHEFNMYKGIKGIPIFLLTLLFLRFKSTVVVTSHGVVDYRKIDDDFLRIFALSKFKKIKFVVKVMFYTFYKLLSILAHKIVVHSNYTKDVYIDSYGINADKCFVIPIGIGPSETLESTIESYEPKDSVWFNNIKGKKIILFFGYILRRKGLELLIEAYSEIKQELSNSILVLAGDILENQKDYADGLKANVINKNLEKDIIFTGFLTNEELSYLYNSCHFVVLPYSYSISSSLPLSFAFGCGKPVIASNVGTLRDEVLHAENGLLFENGNLEDLKEKIIALFNNEALMRSLKMGTANVLKKRSWYNIAKLTNELVHS